MTDLPVSVTRGGKVSRSMYEAGYYEHLHHCEGPIQGFSPVCCARPVATITNKYCRSWLRVGCVFVTQSVRTLLCPAHPARSPRAPPNLSAC
jgi:hypothetical protein